MKKKTVGHMLLFVIIAFSLGFALCSCEKTENALLSEFKAITDKEPTYTNLKQAASFIDSNIESLSQESSSRLILAYEDFLLKFLDDKDLDSHQFSGEELFIYTHYMEDTSVKVVDYKSLINTYGGQMSPELIELLSIKASESENPAVKDASLQLSYEALLQRALRTENLLEEHKSEDVLKASALEYYEMYLFLLLAGSDSSPVFDYDTGAFSPIAKEAYEDFMIEYPQTVLTSIFTEYFAYLNNIKYTIDYLNATENKVFYDTCDYLINKAEQSF
ncbi:MAG: hypothetical protein EOM23_10525 [Candidatus Moranbacteria bacterium]|nr:hypothetical protein [Candidatus Moranbacteria bacterium]